MLGSFSPRHLWCALITALLLPPAFAGESTPIHRVEMTELASLPAGADATPVLRRYLATALTNTRLLLPKGRYNFFPERAAEKYAIISNHDHGIVRIAFDLAGASRVEVDGQGSALVFHGDIIPFNLEGTEQVTLKNLSIDWHRTFHSEGRVVAVDPVAKSFDISISDSYPYRIDGDQLIWLRDRGQSPWNTKAWIQDVRINLFFDPSTKATVYRAKHYKMAPYDPLLSTLYQAKEIKPGLVRIYDSIAELPQLGWIWTSKGGLKPVRLSPAIRIFRSRDLLLEDVTIHHAGGMGVIAERSENIRLNRVRVMLPPDQPERTVSTTADATHFVNCRGSIVMEHCLFENMLDDATNIHGSYLKLVATLDPHTIGVSAPHAEQSVNQWAAPGETLAFRDPTTLEAYGHGKVREFRFINESYAEIVLDQAVGALRPNTGIENTTWAPEFTMTDCTVRNNRARSILLSTHRKTRIENNQFIRPMMAAISIAGDMNYWFESGHVTDVLIRGNTFVDGCTGGFEQAVITIEPIVPAPDRAGQPFHAGIVIEGNTFTTFDQPILDAFFTRGLVFANNRVQRSGTHAPIFPEAPAVKLRYCPEADIHGNEFETEARAWMSADAATTFTGSLMNQGLRAPAPPR